MTSGYDGGSNVNPLYLIYLCLGDHMECVLTLTSYGTNKGDLLLADINTLLKHKNVTTYLKVDTSSNLNIAGIK